MKAYKFCLVLALVCSSLVLSAQAVGINNATPDGSSILDVASGDKGILIPRMSSTDRDNIASPATGLMIYDTDKSRLYYYNGSDWFPFSSGSHNESNRVKILPTDFLVDNDGEGMGGDVDEGMGDAILQFADDDVEDTSGNLNANTGGVVRVVDDGDMYVLVVIPEFFTGTSVDIFGDDNSTMEAYSYDLSDGTFTSLASGTVNTTLSINFTHNVANDNVLMVRIVNLAQGDAASSRIFGGYVTIAPE